MIKTVLLIVAAFAALMPVLVQKTGLSAKYGFSMKMLCAFMYLATGVLAAVAYNAATLYTCFVFAALLFGVLGDFFISYKQDKYFLSGVLFFALGHIVYSIAFLGAGAYKAVQHIIPVAAVSVCIALFLFVIMKTRLQLGKLQIPLVIYAAILFFFFACAVTKGILAFAAGNLPFGLLVMAGGVLFIASDLMLGMRIGGVKLPKPLRHAVSYTYFPAQTLFALSIFFQTIIN